MVDLVSGNKCVNLFRLCLVAGLLCIVLHPLVNLDSLGTRLALATGLQDSFNRFLPLRPGDVPIAQEEPSPQEFKTADPGGAPLKEEVPDTLPSIPPKYLNNSWSEHDWLARLHLCGAPVAITAENIRRKDGGATNFLAKMINSGKPRLPPELAERVLAEMHDSALLPPWPNGPSDGKPLAESCALVSSGGRLLGSKLGKEIDSHTLVIRVNLGGVILPAMIPDDAGRRTNINVMGHRDMRPFLADPGKMVPELCEKMLASIMSGGPPGVRAPEERNAPQFGLLQIGTALGLKTFLDCRQHLLKIGKADDVRKLQLMHPKLMWGGRIMRFPKPSGGWLAFTIAMSLCKHIVPYGFGVVKGSPYHAYKWCDVDRLLGITSMDCPTSTADGSLKGGRTPDGFKGKASFHNFGTEKHAMEKLKFNTPSEECRQRCQCK